MTGKILSVNSINMLYHVFFILIMFPLAQQRRAFRAEIFMMRLQHASLAIGFGTPPQVRFAVFQFHSAYLTVVDSECGHLPPGRLCPKLCRLEGPFALFYCHPFCYLQRKGDYFCRHRNSMYAAVNSTTAQSGGQGDVFEETNDRLSFYKDNPHRNWPTWGVWGLDVATIEGCIDMNEYMRVEMPTYVMPGVVFNRAVMHDKIRSPTILGLRPRDPEGNPSFVPQLYSLGHIQHPQISFAISRMYWRRHPSVHFVDVSVTIGALEAASCYDWILVDAGPEPWSFWMTDVKFMGKTYPQAMLGRISLDYRNVILNAEVRSDINEFGLSIERPEYPLFSNCSVPLSLSFRISNQLVELIERDLTAEECASNPESVQTHLILPNGERRYTVDCADWRSQVHCGGAVGIWESLIE